MFWVLDLVVVSGLRVPERAGTSEARGQQKLSMCFSPENWSLDLIFALHNMNQKHCESNAFEIAFRTIKIILKSLAGFAAVRTSHGIICSAHASESVDVGRLLVLPRHIVHLSSLLRHFPFLCISTGK